MHKIGRVKEIDRLGRLHIPKDIRERFGFIGEVELVLTREGLLIKSVEYELSKADKKVQ